MQIKEQLVEIKMAVSFLIWMVEKVLKNRKETAIFHHFKQHPLIIKFYNTLSPSVVKLGFNEYQQDGVGGSTSADVSQKNFVLKPRQQ